MKLENLEICFYVHFTASYWLKHIKICVTRDWNVDRKRSINYILTDLYRSQSFAQTNFYNYIENIFSKFNHVHFTASYWLKHIKICVTRDWNVDRKRSINYILTDLYRSQSFAQTNFYNYIKNIFSKFNH